MVVRRVGSNPEVAAYLAQALGKLTKEAQFAAKVRDLNIGSELVRCVSYHLNDPSVVEEGCNAVGTMAVLSPSNRTALVEEGAFTVVIKALYSHNQREAIVEQSVYAIANLSIDLSNSDIHASAFKAINKTLLQNCESKATMLWAFIAITRLCIDDPHMSRLLISPMALVDVILRYSNDAEITVWGLRSTLGLLPPPENHSRFLAGNISECVYYSLSRHNENEAIAELVLIITNLISADSQIIQQLSSLGICTLIPLAIYHFRSNESIAISGFKSLARLAFSEPSNVDSLLDANIVQVVGSVAALHLENDEVSIAVAYAISSVASSTAGRTYLAMDIKVIENTVCSLSKSTLSELSTANCAVIARLAADDIECAEKFGEKGACACVLHALDIFSDDSTLCREACNAIFRLVQFSSANASRFDSSVCPLLTSVLMRHVTLPAVCEKCLLATESLVTLRDDLILSLRENGICEALVQQLKVNMKHEFLVNQALRVVAALQLLNESLGQSGICEAVIATLEMHSSSAETAHLACRAICFLSDDDTNRAILGALKVCEMIIGLLDDFVEGNSIVKAIINASDEGTAVAKWACQAIHCLAHMNQGLQAVFGAKGACELIARTLASYMHDEGVVVASCMAVYTLGEFNFDHKVKLGEGGVCSALMEVLRLYVSNEDVAVWGTRAAASLALESESNVSKLVSSGACETVPVTMQTHQRNESVACAGSSIIACLATNLTTSGRLGHNGAVEALVTALDLHASSALVVSRCAVAIGRLAQSVGNASWLGPAGACEVLLNSIRLHKDDEVVSYEAWYAVGSMAADINNCIRFGAAGACELVVEALTRHPESERIVQSASRAVGKLSKYPKNATIIHSAGDCDVIISSLQKHKGNELAAYQLCQTVSILAYGDDEIRRRLGALGACGLVVEALFHHSNSWNLVNQAFLAIRSLAKNNIENKDAFRSINIVALLLQYRDKFSENTHVLASFCWAVSSLCAEDRMFASHFGDSGACESIVSSLKEFHRYVHISEHASSALYHLTLHNDDACNKCNFCGAAEALVAAVSSHQDSIPVTEYAFLTMDRLCGSSLGRHKIGAAGAAKTMIMCLHTLGRERKIAVFVLNLIISFNCESIENQIRLIDQGAMKAITTCMENYIDYDNISHDVHSNRDDKQKDKGRINRGSSELSRVFTLSNVHYAFSVSSSITIVACRAILSFQNGHKELVRRKELESSASLLGSIMKIASGLDSSDVIINHARKYVESLMIDQDISYELEDSEISIQDSKTPTQEYENISCDRNDTDTGQVVSINQDIKFMEKSDYHDSDLPTNCSKVHGDVLGYYDSNNGLASVDRDDPWPEALSEESEPDNPYLIVAPAPGFSAPRNPSTMPRIESRVFDNQDPFIW